MGKGFFVFPNYVAGGVSDLMYYANLGYSLREDTSDTLGKATEIIGAGDQDYLLLLWL